MSGPLRSKPAISPRSPDMPLTFVLNKPRRKKHKKTRAGCLSCKQRRVKCDEGHPSCERCVRIGVHCTYEHTHSPSTTTSPPDCTVVASEDSLRKSAVQIQLHEDFWSRYLPAKPLHRSSPRLPHIETGDGIESLQRICDQHELAQMSVNLCVLTYKGVTQKRPEWTLAGCRMYGKVLTGLRSAILASSPRDLPGAILCCRFLCLFEMIRPNWPGEDLKARNWQSHASATCKLIEQIPSQNRNHADFERLYLEGSALSLRHNIIHRKSELVARGSAVTHGTGTDAGTLRGDEASVQDLYTLIATLPDLFAWNDRTLETLTTATTQSRRDDGIRSAALLIREMTVLRDQLEKWETVMLRFDRSQSPSSRSLPHSLMRRGLGHNSLLGLCQCWAGLLLVSVHKHRLQTLASTYRPGDCSHETRDVQCQAWISHIIDAAGYLLDREAGLWVAEQAAFPIATAVHLLPAFGGAGPAEINQLKSLLCHAPFTIVRASFLDSIAGAAVIGDSVSQPDQADRHHRVVSRWLGGRDSRQS